MEANKAKLQAIENAFSYLSDKNLLKDLCDTDYYPLTENDLNELLKDKKPFDILMSLGDEFDINDNYCYYDGYGNLVSTSDLDTIFDYEDMAKSYISDLSDSTLNRAIEDDVFNDFLDWAETEFPELDRDHMYYNISESDTVENDWDDVINTYLEELREEDENEEE